MSLRVAQLRDDIIGRIVCAREHIMSAMCLVAEHTDSVAADGMRALVELDLAESALRYELEKLEKLEKANEEKPAKKAKVKS